ncbi:MAG TPA: hypothetical protein VFX59_23815 [Polyangiales bacterium]|nr:hypothetical protein [Polyangiales bacterium]
MREIDPPPPLDARPDTPEELRAVLRALGREGPGRGTLERVASGLAPYMDAAPGLSVPVAEAARTSGKLLAARALAALLALGGTAYLMQRAWVHEDVAPRVAAPQVAAPVQAAVEVAKAPVELAPSTELPVEVPGEPVRRRYSGHKRARVALPAVEPAIAEPVVVEPEPVAAPERASEPAPAEPQPAQRVAPPPDEFSLLWEARVKIRRDPLAALALLNEHAGRFANGQLAPEREVLAVEALRALGRNDEAEARLRSFRARYPGSIHLRRLQQGR